jgi:CelD/BcsL family acetyltransferase involved in cellulose biosynthesis
MIARIATVSGFEAQRARWDALYRSDPLGQVFLSWPWLRAYLEQVRGTWVVLTFRSGEDLVAALPLTLRAAPSRAFPIARELTFASDPIADYQGMLCIPGFEREAVAAFADAVRALPWDRALIRDVADPRIAALLDALAGGSTTVVKTGTTTCLRTALPATWDDYLASVGKTTRAKTSAFLRRIEQQLPNYRVSSPVRADLDVHVDAQVRLNHGRWGGNLRSAHATFGRLFCDAFDRGCLRLIIAWDGDRAIAGAASFVEDVHKTYNLYQLAYDREYGRFSPGKLVASLAIRDAIEREYAVFDFLRGDEQYKRWYAQDVVSTSHYRMTRRTLRSVAYDGVYPAYRALKAVAARVVYGPGRTV